LKALETKDEPNLNSEHIKKISENRKARHDFFIEDTFEAGMVLQGSEVKSLRAGRANLKDAFARIVNGEVFVYQLHISPYPFANYGNHDPLRPRKLLLHDYEIKKLYARINEQGHTLVPLQLYFKDGKVKLVIAVAKGKRKFDKREAIRQRDEKRDLDREKKNW
jgi:SsrA-binding protein